MLGSPSISSKASAGTDGDRPKIIGLRTTSAPVVASAVPDLPSSSALMTPSAVRLKLGKKQATVFKASSVAMRRASGWRTIRPTTWAMWVASLAGRSE
jgi:hypothetical protein